MLFSKVQQAAGPHCSKVGKSLSLDIVFGMGKKNKYPIFVTIVIVYHLPHCTLMCYSVGSDVFTMFFFKKIYL